MKISALFKEFSQSEKASGFVLIGCTLVSLGLANSAIGDAYTHFFHLPLNLSFAGLRLDYSISHWINDGLMAIFFLLVGLEIERELYVGELSSIKNALLPVLAAAGGMLFPALIHLFFNAGTATQPGFGIPMATDIAFALGILSLAGKRVPLALKIFLTALAIIDDLGAITVIAFFYTKGFSIYYFGAALLVLALLFIAGRRKIFFLPLYLLGGIIVWYCMLQSGVHATIAGVLLAFVIPFEKRNAGGLSHRLQHALHKPVAFIILPIFALANTAIIFPDDIAASFSSSNAIGIIAGLVLGKFAGIFLVSKLAVRYKIASLAPGINWGQLLGVSLLGGIGFTMSIFITNLAFSDEQTIIASKMSILLASLVAAVA
ncbi:MAG TPA: Na+/H+ antiporter NhaA, partial [Chitinophagaceae bacterium]|nr:Na+/H+ antiporter NhaA [Chitinophagaceae bacterium]